MTPLLHKIVTDLCQPTAKRRLRFIDTDHTEMRKLIEGVHSFECSGIRQLAFDLAARVLDDGIDITNKKTTTFLPGPRTWIEYRKPDERKREAMILINDNPADQAARFIWLIEGDDWVGVSEKHGTLLLNGEIVPVLTISNRDHSHRMAKGGPKIIAAISDVEERGLYGNLFITAEVYALLGMINTPRVFQRLVHAPHAGLQRKLVAAQPLVGKFPLGAWTEILLKVPAPQGQQSIKGDGSYLTGDRALHWCRAHLRHRLGQWEIVSDHWRGNPAIGIKQSRYRVESSGADFYHQELDALNSDKEP